MAFSRWLRNFKIMLKPKAKSSPGSTYHRPAIEALEERRVPSWGGWGSSFATGHFGQFLASDFVFHRDADDSISSSAGAEMHVRHHDQDAGDADDHEASDSLSATNLNQTKTYSAGAASVALDDIAVSDANSNATITATLTLADPATGTLSAASGNGESYDSSTGVWTVSGSLTKVNAALAAVAFLPKADNTSDTTIAVKISDGSSSESEHHCGGDDSSTLDGTIKLNVSTSASNAPTATNLNQTKTYTAGAASVALDDIVVSDSNSSATITAKLTLANTSTGSLTASSGNGESYDSSTGVWTVTGSLTKVNAALAAVAFVPASTNAANTTVAVSIRDASGAGPNGSIALDVASSNNAPTATNLNQTKSFTAGAETVDLDHIVVSDATTGATITAKLTLADPTSGSLTATSGNGESYNASTGVWTVTGTADQVNAALAGVAFVPNPDNPVNASIAVQVRDSSGSGPDGTIALTVTTESIATNGISQTTTDGSQVSSENGDDARERDQDDTASDSLSATNLNQAKTYSKGTASVALDPIVVSDTNSSANITATLTLDDPAVGSLTAASGNGETYDSTKGVWTVTGSVAKVNAALAAVAFIPGANNTTNTTIDVDISDGSQTHEGHCGRESEGLDGTISLNVATTTSTQAVTTATADLSWLGSQRSWWRF
jgi:hypothetical protein